MNRLFLALLILSSTTFLFSCQSKQENTLLAKAHRENKNGWVYVHLEGKPFEIGYQHGYLLAQEIDTNLKMMSYFLEHETHKDWQFYRQCAQHFFWQKTDREYKDEINGIVAGLQDQHQNYDSLDITAL